MTTVERGYGEQTYETSGYGTTQTTHLGSASYQGNGVLSANQKRLRGGSVALSNFSGSSVKCTSSTNFIVSDDPALNFGSGSFTVYCQITTQSDTGFQDIVQKPTGGQTRSAQGPGWILRATPDAGNGGIEFAIDDGTNIAVAAEPGLPVGSTFSLAGIREAGVEVRIVRDGVTTVTDAESVGSVSNTVDLTIADSSADPILDNVMLYDRALSDSEIQVLDNGGMITNGLVAHWSFDDRGATTTADVVGSNDADVLNNPTYLYDTRLDAQATRARYMSSLQSANGTLSVYPSAILAGSVALKGTGSLDVLLFKVSTEALTITDAQLKVYNIANHSDTPDHVIQRRFESVEFSQFAHDSKDEGQVVVDNSDGALTDILTIGKRVEVEITTAQNPNHPFTWTAWIGPRDLSIDTNHHITMSLDLEDYVGGVMSNRKTTDTYINDTVHDIITGVRNREVAMEVDLDLDPLTEVTDQFFRQTDAWEAVLQMADRNDALVLSEGRSLKVREIDGITKVWDMTPKDYSLPVNVRENPDNMFNQLRTDSGEATALEASNTGFDHYVTVDDTTRLTTQVSARKAEISRIRVWTNPSVDGEVSVRLQADEGGAPINIASRDSDIARRTLSVEFLADEGFTEFWIPDHTLPDRNPWIIVEADEAGEQVGVDVDGNLLYETYYPYPLNIRVSNGEMQRKYRRREATRKKEVLDTIASVRDWSEAELKRNVHPESVINLNAYSERMHRLKPGESIGVALGSVGATGEYIVAEKTLSADASSNAIRFDCTVKVQSVETL